MSFVIDPSSLAQVVADNIRRLVDTFHQGRQSDAARHLKMHQRTLGRAMNGEQAASLDTVEAVAKGYGLRPWQLLVENLDPDHPPTVYDMTPAEVELYARLKTAAEDFAKNQK